MIDFFESLPWFISGLFWVLGFTLLSLLGLFMVRRLVSPIELQKSHDVAGFTFGIIGVIYAVLLGFTVVQVNDRFHDAEKNILAETATMMELFRDVTVFSDKDKLKVRQLLREYAVLVYEDEWALMAEEMESEKTREIFHAIWRAYSEIEPVTEQEKIWYSQSLSKLNDLSEYRVNRLFNTSHSLGPLMWTLLIAGAVIIIVFMYFFSPENVYAQALMTSLLAGIVAFMLFLIMSLSGIYRGDVSVQPTEVKKAIERFDEALKDPDLAQNDK